MTNIKLLQFTRKTMEYYMNEVAGNQYVLRSQARRKMTRNMLLAEKIDSTGYLGQMYKYGFLVFVVKDNKIVYMKNKCKPTYGWIKDQNLYDELNEQLGIQEDRVLV